MGDSFKQLIKHFIGEKHNCQEINKKNKYLNIFEGLGFIKAAVLLPFDMMHRIMKVSISF